MKRGTRTAINQHLAVLAPTYMYYSVRLSFLSLKFSLLSTSSRSGTRIKEGYKGGTRGQIGTFVINESDRQTIVLQMELHRASDPVV